MRGVQARAGHRGLVDGGQGGAGSTSSGWFSKRLRAAQAIVPSLALEDICFSSNLVNLTDDGVERDEAGAGTCRLLNQPAPNNSPPDEDGGAVEIDTTATANRFAILRQRDAVSATVGLQSLVIANDKTHNWMASVRHKAQTAIDANARNMLCGITSIGAAGADVGIFRFGATSIANYSWLVRGLANTTADTGVPVVLGVAVNLTVVFDAAAGTLHFLLNDVDISQLTNTVNFGNAPAYWRCSALNGATAASRRERWYKAMIATAEVS